MSNLREWSLGDDAVDSSKDSEGPVEGRASMSNLRPRWERQRHECTQRYCRKRNFPKPCSVHSYLQFTSGKLGNLKTTVVGKRKDPYMGNVCEILLDLHPQGKHGDQNAPEGTRQLAR